MSSLQWRSFLGRTATPAIHFAPAAAASDGRGASGVSDRDASDQPCFGRRGRT